MPYLNWRDQTIARQDIAPVAAAQPEGRLRMVLGLTAEQLSELVPAVRDVLDPDAPGELRVDLPLEWVVFFKKRDGGSRLLVAHPEKDQWVATAAVGDGAAAKLAQGFEALSSGQSMELGQVLGGVDRVSNLELVIEKI